MTDMGLGAGLTALAFWGFLATIVVGGMWYSLREKEARQETLRRLVESGQAIDEALVDKLLAVANRSDHLDRDLRVSGIIVLPIAVGLALFGVILGTQFSEALASLLGAGVLLGFVGIGLLVAARVASGDKGGER